jgi:CheY-like chemotaxis protein
MKTSNKVLLIDDDEVFLNTQSKFLTLSGFIVIKDCDGKIGFERLMTEVPDIVVCDMIMYDFDGFDFLSKFSKTQFFHKIPFLCISGYIDEYMAEKCISYGADGYLKKPVDCDVLTSAIFMLIDHYSK